jgi:hypothetical protein
MNNKLFEIAKWLLIISMTIAIIILWRGNHNLQSSYEALKMDGTYITNYQSKTIRELKKENSELYDSIKKLKNVKQAMIIKYKYVYNGDTVYIPRVLPSISTPVPDKSHIQTYTKNTDTLSYKLLIKGDTIDWYKLDFTLNEKLTIINREENNSNEATITTNTGGGTVTGTQIFNQKRNPNSFFNRFSFGVQTGVGYGIISKKPDIYVGVGVTFRLNKIK